MADKRNRAGEDLSSAIRDSLPTVAADTKGDLGKENRDPCSSDCYTSESCSSSSLLPDGKEVDCVASDVTLCKMSSSKEGGLEKSGRDKELVQDIPELSEADKAVASIMNRESVTETDASETSKLDVGETLEDDAAYRAEVNKAVESIWDEEASLQDTSRQQPKLQATFKEYEERIEGSSAPEIYADDDYQSSFEQIPSPVNDEALPNQEEKVSKETVSSINDDEEEEDSSNREEQTPMNKGNPLNATSLNSVVSEPVAIETDQPTSAYCAVPTTTTTQLVLSTLPNIVSTASVSIPNVSQENSVTTSVAASPTLTALSVSHPLASQTLTAQSFDGTSSQTPASVTQVVQDSGNWSQLQQSISTLPSVSQPVPVVNSSIIQPSLSQAQTITIPHQQTSPGLLLNQSPSKPMLQSPVTVLSDLPNSLNPPTLTALPISSSSTITLPPSTPIALPVSSPITLPLSSTSVALPLSSTLTNNISINPQIPLVLPVLSSIPVVSPVTNCIPVSLPASSSIVTNLSVYSQIPYIPPGMSALVSLPGMSAIHPTSIPIGQSLQQILPVGSTSIGNNHVPPQSLPYLPPTSSPVKPLIPIASKSCVPPKISPHIYPMNKSSKSNYSKVKNGSVLPKPNAVPISKSTTTKPTSKSTMSKPSTKATTTKSSRSVKPRSHSRSAAKNKASSSANMKAYSSPPAVASVACTSTSATSVVFSSSVPSFQNTTSSSSLILLSKTSTASKDTKSFDLLVQSAQRESVPTSDSQQLCNNIPLTTGQKQDSGKFLAINSLGLSENSYTFAGDKSSRNNFDFIQKNNCDSSKAVGHCNSKSVHDSNPGKVFNSKQLDRSNCYNASSENSSLLSDNVVGNQSSGTADLTDSSSYDLPRQEVQTSFRSSISNGKENGFTEKSVELNKQTSDKQGACSISNDSQAMVNSGVQDTLTATSVDLFSASYNSSGANDNISSVSSYHLESLKSPKIQANCSDLTTICSSSIACTEDENPVVSESLPCSQPNFFTPAVGKNSSSSSKTKHNSNSMSLHNSVAEGDSQTSNKISTPQSCEENGLDSSGPSNSSSSVSPVPNSPNTSGDSTKSVLSSITSSPPETVPSTAVTSPHASVSIPSTIYATSAELNHHFNPLPVFSSSSSLVVESSSSSKVEDSTIDKTASNSAMIALSESSVRQMSISNACTTSNVSVTSSNSSTLASYMSTPAVQCSPGNNNVEVPQTAVTSCSEQPVPATTEHISTAISVSGHTTNTNCISNNSRTNNNAPLCLPSPSAVSLHGACAPAPYTPVSPSSLTSLPGSPNTELTLLHSRHETSHGMHSTINPGLESLLHKSNDGPPVSSHYPQQSLFDSYQNHSSVYKNNCGDGTKQSNMSEKQQSDMLQHGMGQNDVDNGLNANNLNSCASNKTNTNSRQGHNPTSPQQNNDVASMGVYTPDSTTNSVHSIQGYSQNDFDVARLNIESPTSICSSEMPHSVEPPQQATTPQNFPDCAQQISSVQHTPQMNAQSTTPPQNSNNCGVLAQPQSHGPIIQQPLHATTSQAAAINQQVNNNNLSSLGSVPSSHPSLLLPSHSSQQAASSSINQPLLLSSSAPSSVSHTPSSTTASSSNSSTTSSRSRSSKQKQRHIQPKPASSSSNSSSRNSSHYSSQAANNADSAVSQAQMMNLHMQQPAVPSVPHAHPRSSHTPHPSHGSHPTPSQMQNFSHYQNYMMTYPSMGYPGHPAAYQAHHAGYPVTPSPASHHRHPSAAPVHAANYHFLNASPPTSSPTNGGHMTPHPHPAAAAAAAQQAQAAQHQPGASSTCLAHLQQLTNGIPEMVLPPPGAAGQAPLHHNSHGQLQQQQCSASGTPPASHNTVTPPPTSTPHPLSGGSQQASHSSSASLPSPHSTVTPPLNFPSHQSSSSLSSSGVPYKPYKHHHQGVGASSHPPPPPHPSHPHHQMSSNMMTSAVLGYPMNGYRMPGQNHPSMSALNNPYLGSPSFINNQLPMQMMHHHHHVSGQYQEAARQSYHSSYPMGTSGLMHQLNSSMRR